MIDHLATMPHMKLHGRLKGMRAVFALDMRAGKQPNQSLALAKCQGLLLSLRLFVESICNSDVRSNFKWQRWPILPHLCQTFDNKSYSMEPLGTSCWNSVNSLLIGPALDRWWRVGTIAYMETNPQDMRYISAFVCAQTMVQRAEKCEERLVAEVNGSHHANAITNANVGVVFFIIAMFINQ